MTEVRSAATGTDAELDLALLRVGVFAPLDLEPIRRWLIRTDVAIEARANRDGHRVLAIVEGHRTVAWVHPDGQVVTAEALRALVA